MPSPKPEHTREALVAAAKAVAARTGAKTLTIGAFCAGTGINPSRVYARFDDWPTLCRAAGLRPGDKPPEIPTDKLLSDLYAAVMQSGGFERRAALIRRCTAGEMTYTRRFGDWGGALRALKAWVRDNAPGFPYMLELEKRLADQARRRPYRHRDVHGVRTTGVIPAQAGISRQGRTAAGVRPPEEIPACAGMTGEKGAGVTLEKGKAAGDTPAPASDLPQLSPPWPALGGRASGPATSRPRSRPTSCCPTSTPPS